MEEEHKEPAVEDTTLANSDVTTKYQEAAKITNAVLAEVIAMCVPGAKVFDICSAGDASILAKTELIFRNKKDGKKIEKGIAFPVSVSVNNCVCHFSPSANDDPVVLALNDMVKIDLGCHVDGYIASVAHTVTVGRDTPAGDAVPSAEPVTGPRADVVNAAYLAAEVASRLIRPGNTNKQVAEAVRAVAQAYGVNIIIGTLMHQMKRFVIDASKVILLREEGDQKVAECTFEPNEVYAVDVAVTTGDGNPREADVKTTVFKRVVDKNYNLKLKASRGFFSEVTRKFPTMPFALRSIEDERQAKLGVRECVQHDLLAPYPVLFERPNAFVAHVKFTVLLLPGGTVKITGISPQEGLYSSPDKQVSDEIKAILAEDANLSKKRKKKNAKKKAASAAAADDETAENDA